MQNRLRIIIIDIPIHKRGRIFCFHIVLLFIYLLIAFACRNTEWRVPPPIYFSIISKTSTAIANANLTLSFSLLQAIPTLAMCKNDLNQDHRFRYIYLDVFFWHVRHWQRATLINYRYDNYIDYSCWKFSRYYLCACRPCKFRILRKASSLCLVIKIRWVYPSCPYIHKDRRQCEVAKQTY